MSFLLDTNVLSEVRKPRPHPSVAAWFARVRAEDLFLSVLVVGEIQQGVARLRSRDPARAATYETWLRRLRQEYSDRLLPVTEAVALEWGAFDAGQPLPAVDGLLAATAKVHDLTLVTRNVADFERTGIALFDPFE